MAERNGWLARTFGRRWLYGPIGLALITMGAGIGAALAGDGDDDPLFTTGPQMMAGDPSGFRQPIHEHAEFALYIRGERFDFGQPQFVSTIHRELSPNVHIHDPRHNVVHVHREGTTWDEFFLSLGFELSDVTNLGERGHEWLKLPSGEVLRNGEGGAFTFILNDVKVDGIAGLNIGARDRVLLSFGDADDATIQAEWATVTTEACIPQDICLARGNGEAEPCSVAGMCID